MTSPWHRSRLFWSGLPGVLMLLWMGFGNRGTIRHMEVVTWDRYVYCMGWGNGNAAVGAFRPMITESRVLPWYTMPDFINTSEPVDPIYPLQVIVPNRYGMLVGDISAIVLPVWLLATLYTCVWLGAITLWQRRKHRLTLPATPSPAARSSTKAHASRP